MQYNMLVKTIHLKNVMTNGNYNHASKILDIPKCKFFLNEIVFNYLNLKTIHIINDF